MNVWLWQRLNCPKRNHRIQMEFKQIASRLIWINLSSLNCVEFVRSPGLRNSECNSHLSYCNMVSSSPNVAKCCCYFFFVYLFVSWCIFFGRLLLVVSISRGSESCRSIDEMVLYWCKKHLKYFFFQFKNNCNRPSFRHVESCSLNNCCVILFYLLILLWIFN